MKVQLLRFTMVGLFVVAGMALRDGVFLGYLFLSLSGCAVGTRYDRAIRSEK